MKYFLFVKFNSGLMHNAIYKTLGDILESVKQLICDEDLDTKGKRLPSVCELKNHLNKHDDYFEQLSSGTWYHV